MRKLGNNNPYKEIGIRIDGTAVFDIDIYVMLNNEAKRL